MPSVALIVLTALVNGGVQLTISCATCTPVCCEHPSGTVALSSSRDRAMPPSNLLVKIFIEFSFRFLLLGIRRMNCDKACRYRSIERGEINMLMLQQPNARFHDCTRNCQDSDPCCAISPQLHQFTPTCA